MSINSRLKRLSLSMRTILGNPLGIMKCAKTWLAIVLLSILCKNAAEANPVRLQTPVIATCFAVIEPFFHLFDFVRERFGRFSLGFCDSGNLDIVGNYIERLVGFESSQNLVRLMAGAICHDTMTTGDHRFSNIGVHGRPPKFRCNSPICLCRLPRDLRSLKSGMLGRQVR
jgi:hypothetical protein